MKNLMFIAAITAVSFFSSCTPVKTAAYQEYPTVCLGKSMDGTQTLQVWARGKNRQDSQTQAMKKAVYELVFEGISAGGSDCDTRPIVIEANARTKHQDYFDTFFADGGAYTQFVERLTPNVMTRAINKQKGEYFKNDGIIVQVKRSALRKKLISDQIIKQ